jgi:thiol-disulfide isomerase/thioredoxin
MNVSTIISTATTFAKKNGAMLIIAIAVIAATLYYFKNRRSINGFVSGGSDPTLYFVYATWCPHCKTVLPEMTNLNGSLPLGGGRSCNVEIIESEEKDKIRALGHPIEGYPTFVLKTASGMQEYNGNRNVDSIAKWVASLI